MTIIVQFAITILPPQPIISGETDFHIVDSVGKVFSGVEALVLREDESEADDNEAGRNCTSGASVLPWATGTTKATQENIRRWLGYTLEI